MLSVPLALGGAASHAFAADEPVRIGMVTTLSTKAGYLGADVRDGFMLAIKQGGGALGGVPVELLVEDDDRDPGKGREIADRFIERDGVRIMTGIIFSNVGLAVMPKVVKDGVIYVSPNSGPSQMAGKGCHPYHFNVAWQNDNLHEAMGQYATDAGLEKVFILAPNYPAGKDALAGFKRFYDGEPVGETYTQLGQSDYAAEIAAIRDADPDGVFFFLPGGMGINFMKQFHQSGLGESVQLIGSAFSADHKLLNAVGEAAEGMLNSAQWSPDLDNPVNHAFVEAYMAEYDAVPTIYSQQGYDAALAIGAALEATGGDLSDLDAFAAALKTAEFESPRGPFKFGVNNFPVQNIYLRKAVMQADGTLRNEVQGTIFTDQVDAYAAECSME
ncbi:ABC transporter substrate-binding protein [Roseospira navarrensis]|uniref:ABC transporter substrate-binding protein n=2 Tax=Roseospira navarrensis TaxID=140058 RepID=A0A7X2D2Q3_9PROT|nr:ABC transporter substrate-binding protein [Roseospira navarrensis]